MPSALLQARQALSAVKFDAVFELATPAFLEARDLQDWNAAAEAAILLARAHGSQRRSEEALRWAHETRQAAALAGRDDLLCASWVAVAREHAQREEGGRAQEAVDEVLALVDRLRTPEALESAYSGLTAVYSDLGMSGLAVSCARQALLQSLSTGDTGRISLARTNLLIVGGVACEQLLEPDPDAARRLLDELRPQLAELDKEVTTLASPMAEARVLRVRGALLNCEARWQEACDAFTALAAGSAKLPPPLACSAWIELGLVQRRLGRNDESMASGRAAESINPVPVAPRRAVDLRRMALICELTGRPQEALDLLRRYQDRRHHMVTTALESRAAALKARLDEQTLRVENLTLRQRNAHLQASVEDVRQLASTDPLTGLPNRRGLDAIWNAGAAEPQRVLALIDLDHFKRINDERSHAAGDAVLREVAKIMRQALRSEDAPTRYGGEEFAVLLNGADAAQARAVLERLRAAVQAHDWHPLLGGLPVTLSAGFVIVERDEALEAAAVRADDLLYAAKRAGRNRVVGP